MVKIVNLEKIYKMGSVSLTALADINFRAAKGDFIAIVGPSGSGKTTLLNIIGCLDKPTRGSVEICNEKITTMNGNQLAEIRGRKLGFIFQTFNLIPVLTAYENVELPLLLGDSPGGNRRNRIIDALRDVGLAEHSQHKPDELSGGQRQRVAIARALVKEPEIILADEPTANLDSTTGMSIIEMMLGINQERGTTFIFATHDPAIMKYATTIVRLHDGRLLYDA